MNNKLKQLYESTDYYSGKKINNQDEMIQRGLEKHIDLSYDDIREILKKHNKYSHGITPKIVSEFMKKVITNKSDVLIPWNIYGELLGEVSINTDSSVLISNNDKWATITGMMLKDNKYQSIIGDPLIELEKMKEFKFDLICSFPPMGIKAETTVNNKKIRAELAHLLILKASYKLRESGRMFFVVDHNFFNRKLRNSILPILEDKGIFLDAAFYLPPGTHVNTNIGTYLIVLSKKEYGDLFISELKNENLEQVISGWNNRKDSKVLTNGKLVDHKSFSSYGKLEKELEIERFVKKANLIEVPITDIALQINSVKKEIGQFKEHANSVYLPNIGRSDAVNDQSEMKNKTHNYFQIVLKDSINSIYLAKWFNTEVGLILRDSLTSGAYVGKINKSTLESANLYLPEKSIQQEILDIQSKVDELRNELFSIESKAWNYPNSHEHLNKRLEKLNREDGVTEWIETLPFPLASILYKYYAKTDVFSKKEFLLHFFEAFAQFQVVLMMSAYAKNGEIIDKEYIYEIDADRLANATFGTWVHIGENIAKKLRKLMDKYPDQCLRLFQQKRKSFIEIISSKEVYKILDRTRSYRNDWKGHGGVESEGDVKNRLMLLERELNALRKVIGDIYEGYQLIQPGNGHFSSGFYNCNCRLVKGTRNTFVEKSIEVSNGLDIENLYLLEEDGYDPLKLLPFIKLMPSPKTQVNACYYYNRLDRNGIRMVSYYFDQDAEVTIHDSVLETLINDLK